MDEAKVYKPKEPTYIVSIVDHNYSEKEIGELDNNFGNGLIVFDRYNFRDFENSYSGFTEDMAQILINNFVTRGADKNILYVHCWGGISRSPAVAAAINDIYRIESYDIKQKYRNYNRYVYDTLINVARTNI